MDQIRVNRWTRYGLMLVLVIAFLVLQDANLNRFQAQDGTPPLQIELVTAARAGDPDSGNPVLVAGKDIVTVTIRLIGGTCPVVERTTPVDVVLVIDVSASMEGSKLSSTVEAAVSFLDNFDLNPGDPTSDQVAIVAFSSSAQTISDLTRDRAALEQRLRSLSSIGGTDIAAGLREAREILEGPEHNSEYGAAPVIILLSDGGSDREDAVNEADRARRTVGARIVTIGLGSESEIDSDTLQAIAVSSQDTFFTVNEADLAGIYQQIATQIQPRLAATGIAVTYTYDRALFELQPDSIRPNGVWDGGNTIGWTYESLDSGDIAEFEFEVRATSAGVNNIGAVAVQYTACEAGGVQRTDPGTGPNVTVLLPTSTPSPTQTTTPTIVPTATSSPPATQPVWVDGVTSQTTPDHAGVNSAYCSDGGFWGWWPILLLLVAILLTLFLLFWRFRKGWPASWREAFCLLWRLLLTLWLIWMLYFLLVPLKGQFCEQPESIYFWRMEGETVGIYLTHEDLGTNAPAQVASLNEGGCVGCHAVSSTGGYVAGSRFGQIAISSFDDELVDINIPAGTYMAFSPDGTQLAVTDTDANIQMINLENGVVRPLQGAAEVGIAELMPTWSHDGQSIAFVRAPETQADAITANHIAAIYIVPVTGGVAEELVGPSTNLPGMSYYPAFSPDGRWLAFTHHEGTTTYADPAADIWLLNLQTNETRPINNNALNISDSWPTWSRDGDRLAFNTTRQDSNFDIMVVDVNLATGVTSSPRFLPGASEPGIFEHLPFWGEPIQTEGILTEWGQRFPLILLPLIPILLLFVLCLLWPKSAPIVQPEEINAPPPPPFRSAEPLYLENWRGIDVLWQSRPALVIGMGHAGRHILTHLKKNLHDAGLGQLPAHVPLLCVLSGSQAQQDRRSYRFAGVQLEDDELVAWRDDLRDIVEHAETGEDMALREWVDSIYLSGLGPNALNPQSGLGEHRVLGRLALINNLRGNAAYTGVSVWERLQAMGRRAIDAFGNLQVIIVSALDDDVGSGAFIDIAYMARYLRTALQSEGVDTVHVTVHLVTDRVLDRRSSPTRQANVMAALRELKRFQMGTANPTPMVYRADEADIDPVTGQPQDGSPHSVLFDDIFIHDGESRPQPLNAYEAHQGVYPAIADSLAMWLDTASDEAELARWRTEKIAKTRRLQVEQSQIIVGGMGLYQYRLPFADLLEDITLKFSRQVLHMFLMGESTEPPRLDASLVTERFTAAQETPQQLASMFVQGNLGRPVGLNENWHEALRTLAFRDDQDLVDKANRVRSCKQAEVQALHKWLEQTLKLLMNGRPTRQGRAQNPLVQRSAKISLGIEFLRALLGSRGQFAWLPQAAARVRQVTLKENHPLAEGLDALNQHTQVLYDELAAIAETIGATHKPDSLYASLARRSREMQALWKELGTIKSRAYILHDADEQELSRKWYETYLVRDNVPQALAQLHWYISDGRLFLGLRLGEGDDRIFDPENIHDFEQALLELGRYFAQAVRKRENLATILGEGLLHENNVAAVARQLYEASGANLGVTQERAPDSTQGYILSVNENVEPHELENELLKFTRMNLIRLKTSDPFSLSFAQTIDSVPESSVESLRHARDQYNADEAIINNQPRLTAVFEAEATALDYERGIEQRKGLFQKPRDLLHPVVVTGLADRRKAEVYLLAMAAADQGLREWQLSRNDLRFDTNEWAGTLLTAAQINQPRYGVRMDGLLAFTQMIDHATAVRIYERYRRDDELIERLEDWEVAAGADWLNESGTIPEIQRDLAAVTRLLILQLLGD